MQSSSDNKFREYFHKFSGNLLFVQNHENYTDALNSFAALEEHLNKFNIKTCAVYGGNTIKAVKSILGLIALGITMVPLPFNSETASSLILKETNPDAILLDEDVEFGWFEDEFVTVSNVNGMVLMCNRKKSDITVTFLEPSIIIYSSGTTGKPKGLILPARSLLLTVNLSQQILPLTAEDRHISYLPLHHVFEIWNLLRVVTVGGSIWACQTKQPFHVAIEVAATILCVVPKILARLDCHLPNRLHILFSGGAALEQNIIQNALKYTAESTVVDAYGMSEASGPICFTLHSKERSQVHWLPSIEYMQNNFGELLIRGETIAFRYLNLSPQQHEKESFFSTGDVVELADGKFQLKGRTKNTIKLVQGVFVCSPEYLESLYKLQHYQQIVVIANEHSSYLQALVFIPPGIDHGYNHCSKEDIETMLHTTAQSYKLPFHEYIKNVEIIKDSIEDCFTATGKLVREKIYAKYATIIKNLLLQAKLMVVANN